MFQNIELEKSPGKGVETKRISKPTKLRLGKKLLPFPKFDGAII